MATRVGIGGVVVVLGLTSAVLAQERKFYPDDPLSEEPELFPTIAAERRDLSEILELVGNVGHELALAALGEHLGGRVPEQDQGAQQPLQLGMLLRLQQQLGAVASGAAFHGRRHRSPDLDICIGLAGDPLLHFGQGTYQLRRFKPPRDTNDTHGNE